MTLKAVGTEQYSRDTVYQRLRQSIIDFSLLPGEFLSENTLAAQMNTSRTPVREAISRLESEHCVEVFPQRGTQVSRISMDRVQQAVFFRTVLERDVLEKLCKPGLRPEQMAELEHSLALQREYYAKQMSTPLLEEDTHMHRLFYRYAGYERAWDAFTQINCDMLRIGMLPMTCMGSYDKAMDFAKQADEMAARLKEEGIDLYYHNHHVEFARYNGQYLLDIIKDNTTNLGFELDIHWIHRGGENPVEFIKKYAGRIRLLHLKDYRIGEMKMPEGGLDMTNKEFIMKFMAGFYNVVQFAEVGEGSMPVKECIEAGLAGGSEYFLVEQDDTYGRDPFESLKISHDNLVKLGYGDWFKL